MAEREEIYKLRGKTLQVYLYMLRRGEPLGVRELQRALRFSSPSVAHHHLEKLKDMKLVSRDERGRYMVVEKVDIGILKLFVMIGGKLVPRMLFYAAFLTALLTLYLIRSFPSPDLHAITIGVLSSIFFWIETARLWRHKLW